MKSIIRLNILMWVLAGLMHYLLDFRAAVPMYGAAGIVTFFLVLMWFTFPKAVERAKAEHMKNRTQVPEAEARAIWLEGYRRACADFAGAPFTFGVVMDDKMEEHFQNWYTGAEDY